MISICGLGILGSAIYNYFSQMCVPKVYDKYKKMLKPHNFYQSQFIFICLPTPTSGGAQDLTELFEFLNESRTETEPTYIIKSTIAPSYVSIILREYPKLKFVFNPEFLNSYNAIEDFENDKEIILGGEIINTREVELLYEKISTHRYYHCTALEAMWIKYIHNVYGAWKVSFWHEMFDIAQKKGFDFRKIKKILRENKNYYSAYDEIYLDGKPGFGGACFPKDLAVFINESQSRLINHIQVHNQNWRDYELDFPGLL